MRKSKYDKEMLIKIAEHKATVNEIAKLYNVSSNAIIQALKKYKLKSHTRKVLITMPDKKIICNSVSDAAFELGICRQTLQTSLKGKKSRILTELNIEVNYYDEVN